MAIAPFKAVNTFVPKPLDLALQIGLARQQAHDLGEQAALDFVEQLSANQLAVGSLADIEEFEIKTAEIQDRVANLMNTYGEYGSQEFKREMRNIVSDYRKDPFFKASNANKIISEKLYETINKEVSKGNVDYNIDAAREQLEAYNKYGTRGLQKIYGTSTLTPTAIPEYEDYRTTLRKQTEGVQPDVESTKQYRGKTVYLEEDTKKGISPQKIASIYGLKADTDEFGNPNYGYVNPDSLNSFRAQENMRRFLNSNAGRNLINDVRYRIKQGIIPAETPEDEQAAVEAAYLATIDSVISERTFDQNFSGEQFDSGMANYFQRRRGALEMQKEERNAAFFTSNTNYRSDQAPENVKETQESLKDIKFTEEGEPKVKWYTSVLNYLKASAKEEGTAPKTSFRQIYGMNASELPRNVKESDSYKELQQISKNEVLKDLTKLSNQFPELSPYSSSDRRDILLGAVDNLITSSKKQINPKVIYNTQGKPEYRPDLAEGLVREAVTMSGGFKVLDPSGTKTTDSPTFYEAIDEIGVSREELDNQLKEGKGVSLILDDPSQPVMIKMDIERKGKTYSILAPAGDQAQDAFKIIHEIKKAQYTMEEALVPDPNTGVVYKIIPRMQNIDKETPSNSKIGHSILLYTLKDYSKPLSNDNIKPFLAEDGSTINISLDDMINSSLKLYSSKLLKN